MCSPCHTATMISIDYYSHVSSQLIDNIKYRDLNIISILREQVCLFWMTTFLGSVLYVLLYHTTYDVEGIGKWWPTSPPPHYSSNRQTHEHCLVVMLSMALWGSMVVYEWRWMVVMVAAAVHHSRVGSNIMYCNVRQAKSRKLLECLFVVL